MNCPVKRCLRQIKPGDSVMCRTHWTMLPAAIRDLIWKYAKENFEGSGFLSACAVGIEYVEGHYK